MSLPYRGIKALEGLPLWDGSGNAFSPIEVPRALLDYFGNPQDSVPTVHVGGTNGKGSVSTYIAASLDRGGMKVGQFASPHLTHVTERCLLHGRPAPISLFDEAVSRVMDAARALELSPSYFVVGSVASFLIFEQEKVDAAVIEVGLGGTFDATNLIAAPRASVITSIGFDHMHILGDSIEAIASNKAGIIKAGVPVFTGMLDPRAETVVREEARRIGAPVEALGREFFLDTSSQRVYGSFGTCSLPELLFQGTRGRYQQQNAALAARVAHLLGASEQAISSGIASARWPGRFEMVQVPRAGAGSAPARISVLLDAAHNPQGVSALLESLDDLLERKRFSRVVFMLSMLERKAYPEMVSQFRTWAEEATDALEVGWVATQNPSVHTLSAEKLGTLLPGALVEPDVRQALAAALDRADDQTLIVAAGSIFYIGELRPLLVDEPFSTF